MQTRSDSCTEETQSREVCRRKMVLFLQRCGHVLLLDALLQPCMATEIQSYTHRYPLNQARNRDGVTCNAGLHRPLPLVCAHIERFTGARWSSGHREGLRISVTAKPVPSLLVRPCNGIGCSIADSCLSGHRNTNQVYLQDPPACLSPITPRAQP